MRSDSTLEFRRVGGGLVPFVDGMDVRSLVDTWRTSCVLDEFEASVAARLLQGWVVPDDDAPTVHPGPRLSPRGRTVRWTTPETQPTPTVVLPGGSTPAVNLKDLAEFADSGAPLCSCACGSGVGCWGGDVEVSIGHDTVYWTVEASTGPPFAFPLWQYREAIRHLLVLLDEAPILIDEVTAP